MAARPDRPVGAARAGRCPGTARLKEDGMQTVLGLAEGTRLQALVVLTTELARSGDALIAAARRCDADLVFTGGRPPGAGSAGGRELPGGERLLGVVRQLQAEGRVVLLVSDQAAALGNADCGIGIDAADGKPPWGAHVLVGDDLENAALLIDSVQTARTVCAGGCSSPRWELRSELSPPSPGDPPELPGARCWP